jgi:hypothetical protein
MMIDGVKSLSGLELFFWFWFVLFEITGLLYALCLIIYESPSLFGIGNCKKIISNINVIRSCRAVLKKKKRDETLALRYKHVLFENECTGMV